LVKAIIDHSIYKIKYEKAKVCVFCMWIWHHVCIKDTETEFAYVSAVYSKKTKFNSCKWD
jgi:hypothetical protein